MYICARSVRHGNPIPHRALCRPSFPVTFTISPSVLQLTASTGTGASYTHASSVLSQCFAGVMPRRMQMRNASVSSTSACLQTLVVDLSSFAASSAASSARALPMTSQMWANVYLGPDLLEVRSHVVEVSFGRAHVKNHKEDVPQIPVATFDQLLAVANALGHVCCIDSESRNSVRIASSHQNDCRPQLCSWHRLFPWNLPPTHSMSKKCLLPSSTP